MQTKRCKVKLMVDYIRNYNIVFSSIKWNRLLILYIKQLSLIVSLKIDSSYATHGISILPYRCFS